MSIRLESRAKFEKQGIYLTRQNLQMGNLDGREHQEAIIWLAEQERTADQGDTVHYRLMLGFTIVAAFGALIAAWPVVKQLLVS